MATPTYDLIDSQVLSTSAASVTFSSIPATYRDLVLVIDGTSTSTETVNAITFNNDTGSNYSYVWMLGTGSTTSSSSGTTTSMLGGILTSSQSNAILQIMDYSATDKHKTALLRANYSVVMGRAMRWANTAAINEIDITFVAANAAAGTTIYLYGVAA